MESASLDPARLMAVVNVTPDSFSDGGLWFSPQEAVRHALELIGQGAEIIDIGGESTRPGARPVTVEDEYRRVIPVVKQVATAHGNSTLISVDTTKATIADAALKAGAGVVNDISALSADSRMVNVVAEHSATCCLMHMQGKPQTMQDSPTYGDVVDEVKAFLLGRAQFAIQRGVAEKKIWLDPGIGFGKTVNHNVQLLQRLDEIVALGFPVVVGVSRKSFLGELTGQPVQKRLAGTIAANLAAYQHGAQIFRVHDVVPLRDALAVFHATVLA